MENKTKVALLLLLILYIAPACKKIEDETGEILHKIPAGKHYSDNRFIARGDLVIGHFYVHQSWVHTEKTPAWNKLIGLSAGIDPKQNSARLAWRCIGGSIRLAAMFHRDGSAPAFVELAEVALGSWHTFKVYQSFDWVKGESVYCVDVDGATASKPGYKYRQNLYLCHPYYGGSDPAPHDMFFIFKLI